MYAIDRQRAAYFAAFGWQPEHEWQRLLRVLVKDALHGRQGRSAIVDKRGRLSKRQAWIMSTGAEIALALRMTLPPSMVPAGLTGAEIETVLQSATLARGGGDARAKPRRSWL